MSEENIFAIRDRTKEFFQLHNTAAPEPQFAEEPFRYRQRLLSCAQSVVRRSTLSEAGRVWAEQNLGKHGERALDSAERALIHDTVPNFKKAEGPLREVHEQCPRTGRVVNRFYGDIEEAFKHCKQQPRLARFTPGLGRGADSVQARAAAEAGRHELGLAYAALARERAAAGE